MDLLKKPYEISLWEDVLTFVVQNGDYIDEYEESLEDAVGQVIAQYYKERLICIIGSDTMDTPIRATQPKLVSKVNGENILTFNMYSHYYDTTDEEYYTNPFIKLLVNERKVKIRYGELGAKDTKWYDLVIKNIQENSETKTYTYTAKDQFVNELSKSGFNLEFNQELENNMGNIETLAERILDESDWQLRPSGEILKQTIEEPLYKIQLADSITLKDMEGKVEDITLYKNDFVYAFYSNITNEESYVQLLYAEIYETNDDCIITNSPNYYLEGVGYTGGKPNFAASMSIATKYRGERLVRKVKTKYDSTIDKYVNVYNNDAVYGYTETEYLSPATVHSYITNPNSFDSYVGWEVGCSSDNLFPKLELVSVPDVRDMNAADVVAGDAEIISCLKLITDNSEQKLYNSGIVDMRHHINGFVKDEEYIFRVKYGQAGQMGAHGAIDLIKSDIRLTLTVAEYNLNNGKYEFIGEPYFAYTFPTNHPYDDEGYLVSSAVKCKESLTYGEMINMSKKLGLFIQTSKSGTIYIEDIQFFPYVKISSGVLYPGQVSDAEVKVKYIYYTPDKTYTKIEDIKKVYEGYSPSSAYIEDYNDIQYEKVRSITASESNRFNLIQELCEIFECWPKFEIEHDPLTGIIKLDENYRQKKYVSFHEYIGKDNYTGFKYGINLKSIQRTIESEGIVSKLIVKNNSNEFATDGFCSIARASESPNGENFILDFSYYIQQDMMGLAEITNDLYLDIDGYLGYYKTLKRINTKRDQYIKEQSGLLTDIAEYTASYQTYSISAQEAGEQHRDKLNYIFALTGYTFEQLMANQDENAEDQKAYEWWSNDQVLATVASIGRLTSIKKNHETLANQAQVNLKKAQSRFDLLNRILTSKKKSDTEERLLLDKEKLNIAFYKKYSRFLQEGSWISEDYIDDNLYFLDAQSTLSTSAKPKITYNISVLELSRLEGFENYTFALGDKTTIEDTEFFGWTQKEGVQTPYQEEIVVTELTVMFDSPEQNQIKVQNYKTQFEDLFQRMAATTQSVEYSTGKYQKVAGVIETDGTINITTLQNSIANNALTLQNAKDQSVVWDETGITTTSTTNPAEILRIVSGGVFLSVDGGITWNTGITGRGINASYITSGQMNVEEVNILNGSFPSFRWDKTGISAYECSINYDTKKAKNFNFSKFVRLDQYGLYGINGYSNFNSTDPEVDSNGNVIYDENGELIVGENKIWKNSNFALTWSGFQIRSKKFGLDGYIRITEENDIQLINKVVLDGKAIEIDQVKIGLLDKKGDEAIYGLRLKDHLNQVVLEQSSQGKVWIRDELKIGTTDTSTVSLGYLKKYRNDETAIKDEEGNIIGGVSQVIRAGDSGTKKEFIVYEDGYLAATGGYFRGEIHADSGTIGGVSIQTILSAEYEVLIEVTKGIVFKDKTEEKTLTARLYKNKEEVSPSKIKSYNWILNGETVGTTQEIKVNVSDFKGNAEYICEIEYSSDK